MAAKKNLVIVESPAKAKTIGKYLGPAYQVKACMGHLRDLPKSKLGVDVDNDFEPNYRPIKGKEDIIRDLKQAAKDSDAVYLATDPDREGEAISWHLKQLLDLPEDKTFRVTFNEITRKVVTESIRQPRDIDQDLVDAQQARRILDRIVGYELSPLLWKKIRRGLSAGRVQSVAMRLVADREKEIADFVPQEYWTLDALLKNDQGARFKAHYYGRCGKKYEPTSQQEVDGICAQLQDTPFAVSNVKRTDKRRSPSPPFTTSTMQQEASRKLNMTPKRTMAIAQQLYEGVDVAGEGTLGLITYMRTDSLRLSEEAVEAARVFICQRYALTSGTGERKVHPQALEVQHDTVRPEGTAAGGQPVFDIPAGQGGAYQYPRAGSRVGAFLVDPQGDAGSVQGLGQRLRQFCGGEGNDHCAVSPAAALLHHAGCRFRAEGSRRAGEQHGTAPQGRRHGQGTQHSVFYPVGRVGDGQLCAAGHLAKRRCGGDHQLHRRTPLRDHDVRGTILLYFMRGVGYLCPFL